MRTIFCFVQSPHAKTADVTSRVVAGRNGLVGDRVGADEADVAVVCLCVVVLSSFGSGEHACLEGHGGRISRAMLGQAWLVGVL